MPLVSHRPKAVARIKNKLLRDLTQLDKEYRQSRLTYDRERTILFIVGCQRSGTTMMTHIFDKDPNSKVYGEFSKLSSQDKVEKLRLDPLDSVKRALARDRAPLVVLKPLVETQNAPELLAFFERSKALWMYRHYKDVAASNLKNFGTDNGVRDLRPLVREAPDNWRSEKASGAVRAVIQEHFHEGMNPHDAAALFWFARNSLLFDRGLDRHPSVMICKYEDLVSDPWSMVKRIYDFAEQPFPGEAIFAGSHRESLGKGQHIRLSPEVEQVCEALWQRLNAAYRERSLPAREPALT